MNLAELLVEEEVLDTDGYEDVRFEPVPGQKVWPDVSEWRHREWSHWLEQHGWTQERVDRYLQHDRYRYGVGFRRHEREPYTWFYLPTPAAVPLHASSIANVLYGGARGGSKSHSTRWDAYRHCFSIRDYRSIIMRRTFEELKQNHMDKARPECDRINTFFGDVVMDLVPSEHEIRFPKTNGKIVLAHCQNPGDEEKYLSDEYDDFRPDEMATFEKKQIIAVAGSLRSAKRLTAGKVAARLIGTSNPGGAHTLWLKRWYMDKLVPRAENPKYKPENYAFIPAKLFDNPWLMDEDGTYTTYVERLSAYDAARRRQLLDGDWTAIIGQFFAEFSEASHVQAIEIPEGCKIERWVDWGYTPNPGVCHWVACFPDGRLYVFAEWIFNGEGRQLHVASEVASRIGRLTTEEILPRVKGRLNRSIGDPSMWAKDGHTGESYEETFRRNGVRLTKGDNERVMGWGRYRAWLRPHPAGGRWLMYHPDCQYAIRTIPALVRSKTDPDDVDTAGEDHAADCFTGDTLIATEHGERPLATIQVGDLVWTRSGLRAVRDAFSLGVRPTVMLRSTGGHSLCGTPNHPIWTDEGWRPLGALRSGDMLRTWGIPTSTVASPVASGGDQWGRFLAAITSIIAMGTPRTISSRIWRVSLRVSMSVFIRLSVWRAVAWNAIVRWRHQLVNDFARWPVSLVGGGALDAMIWSSIARDVDASSGPIAMTTGSTVRGVAERDTTVALNRSIDADTADGHLWPMAPRCGVRAVVASGPREVFNLTVDEMPEFFANGLLVHNCDRYGVMARPTPTVFGKQLTPTLPNSVRAMLDQIQHDNRRRPGQVH